MSIDLGLLILRVVVGLLLTGHGAQKLFGWFGGPGLDGFTGWIGSMGLRPPRLWAVLGGLAEFGGGLLLVLGLFTPLGSLGILASMLMAIIQVHWPKIWAREALSTLWSTPPLLLCWAWSGLGHIRWTRSWELHYRSR